MNVTCSADPGVLEDVQRALRAKARREARLRTQSTPLRVEPPRPLDLASVSSAGSSPSKAVSPAPPFPRVSGDSEIDFSPAVNVVPLHPVPSSSDGGATLDWSSPASDEGRERRWSLSRSKRRSKDHLSFSASRATIEKQEAVYASECAVGRRMAIILTKQQRNFSRFGRRCNRRQLRKSRWL